jgi:hypothetical protein
VTKRVELSIGVCDESFDSGHCRSTVKEEYRIVLEKRQQRLCNGRCARLSTSGDGREVMSFRSKTWFNPIGNHPIG